jgi:ubiquinone biosynthesis monooxygenase Coq7
MRVNHVGEVCAQAMYKAQALASSNAALRSVFEHAAAEEADHLAWTKRRVEALGGRVSVLNPLWYGGAFALGLVAARVSDRFSLTLMAETERQVELHLQNHLQRLPVADTPSRAVVEQMQQDEIKHAQSAVNHGAGPMPLPLQRAMQAAARIMTTTAHYL